MKGTIFKLLGVCGVLALTAFALTERVLAVDDSGQWKIQVTGVSVISPPPKSSENLYSGNSSSGVTVTLAISPAQGRIVAVNNSASKLISFTDDKGTDLAAAPSGNDPFAKPRIDVWWSSSATNGVTAIRAEAKTPVLPAKTATVLNVSGIVSLQVASQQKKLAAPDVELKAGTKFALGDFTMTVTKTNTAKNPFSKQEEFYVDFTSPTDLESIASLEFMDARGNLIPSHKQSWGGGMGGYFAEYSLKTNVDRATIAVSVWTDLKTAQVPVNLKVGLGL